MDININKGVYLLLLIILSFSALFHVVSAEDDIGAGGGGQGSGSGAQYWSASGEPWSGSGTTDAWKEFYSTSGSRFYQPVENGPTYDLKGMIDWADSRGMGGFNGESLYDSCRKSEHIWWYGNKAADGKKMYARAGVTHTLPVQQSNNDSADVWARFTSMPSSETGWGGNPGVILVCSATFAGDDPKIPLTFKSKSNVFIYDGTPHTVTGYDLISGSLKSGHTPNGAASGTRTAVGVSNVPFTSQVTISGGGKDVTDEYIITHEMGTIRVMPEPPEPERDDQCRPDSSDWVREIVQNDISIADGFRPAGSPGVAGGLKEYYNAAYNLLSSKPQVGNTIHVWNSWKAGFIAGGKDLSTHEFNLENHANAATNLSKYGGVVNVTRTHHPHRVDVSFCQPQKRDLLTGYIYDAEGNAYPYQYWSEWYDDPAKPLQIESISDGRQAPEHYSYQIIGANCNADGLNAVRSQFSTSNFSLGAGAGSGLLQTQESPGLNFPLGSPGHYTGQEVFYKPDGLTWANSCKDAYKGVCVSTILSGASNDANNNLQINPLFTHKDEAEYSSNSPKGHDYPNEDTDELNFFRDNNDREVRAEVWYPRGTGHVDLINFPGQAAKRTTAKLFDNEFGIDYTPTPEIEVTTIAPWGTNDKFTATGVEQEWSKHINYFNMKSMWSSDKGKPYALGVDWAYRAQAINRSPQRIDGYGVLSTTSPKTYEFEAHCTFKNQIGNYDANITEFPFDPKNGSMKVRADWEGAGKLKTLFTRSVSDKSNK